MIYLDNAATTFPVAQVRHVLGNIYANPGSTHGLGRKAREVVDTSRDVIAKYFNCDPENLVFTSGGSEGNNTVLKIVGSMHPCMTYITDKTEHDSILNAVEDYLCMPYYADVNRDGTVSIDSIKHIMDTKTIVQGGEICRGFVSVMYVNNETGAVNDVKAIAKLCHENGFLFHVDCVQAAPVMRVDLKDIDCDFATFSAHKIHGPKGVGALYIKDRTNVCGLVHGGVAQEFGVRGGTENVAGIYGFSLACTYMDCFFWYNKNDFTKSMHEAFVNKTNECSKNYCISDRLCYTIGEQKGGNIISLRFNGVDAQTLVLACDSFGLCISAGSACRNAETSANESLLAIGLTEEEANCTIRVSFSTTNTISDVEKAAEIIVSCARSIIEMGN